MPDTMLQLTTFFLALALSATTVKAAERPNVLIVMTDDQGLGDFSSRAIPS